MAVRRGGRRRFRGAFNPQAAAEGGFTTSIDSANTTLSGSMSLDANLVLTADLGPVPAGALWGAHD